MQRVVQLVLEAIRGSTRDFTDGHVGQAILLLAVPMVIEMGMESLFAVVDVYFVSQLRADAVATVGLTESLLTIVYTVAMGIGIGVTAVVARRIGEKDELVSKRDQVVHIGAEEVRIARGEYLCTEHCHKYTLVSFAALAEAAGLAITRVWMDPDKLFSVQLLEPRSLQ